MLKQKLVLVLLSAALVSISFTSKPMAKSGKATSTIVDYVAYISDIHHEDGFPRELNLNLYTDHSESVWWKARVRVRMYFEGATGHWEGVPPLRYFVPEWGWGYRTYDAEMPPGNTQYDTLWDIQDGEDLDDTDVTILSFQPE